MANGACPSSLLDAIDNATLPITIQYYKDPLDPPNPRSISVKLRVATRAQTGTAIRGKDAFRDAVDDPQGTLNQYAEAEENNILITITTGEKTMQIFVTGELTYTTKPIIKQLIDAGHQLIYQMNGLNAEKDARDAHQIDGPFQGDWLIDGVAASSLRDTTASYMPLRLALKHMNA